MFLPHLWLMTKQLKKIPEGALVTLGTLRETFAKSNGGDFTDPITAGIFVSIVAWASFQRKDHPTPYWRVLKAHGELNPKYPGGVEAQKALLEKEGHTLIAKGRVHLTYVVKNYEKVLYSF